MKAITIPLTIAFTCLLLGADHSERDRLAGYETPAKSVQTRVIIDVYAPSWCSGCPAKTTALQRAYPAIEFRVHDRPAEYPDKVAQIVALEGSQYPILWWEAGGKPWFINNLSTPAEFHRRWEKTNGTAAVAAMPAPAVYEVYKSAKSQAPTPDQSPTPLAEVRRVLAILRPQQGETFVDYGCGDGRWLIEAARTYGCRAVGVEIDPRQVEIARRAIAAAGLTGRVMIVEGDVLTANVEAQVGVAYLYPDVLAKLKPKLLKLNRFATYMHPVDGVHMSQNGDSWVWTRPAPVRQQVQQVQQAVYGGQYYTGRVCNNRNCSMCNSISRQLGR